ncbi:hypothetical protein GCM10023340_32250 [Nocardioides marinquilinus]|uniref:LppX_LprAFG lipoprotein n=1 Tax=Nocardioides marinquilinus TaxID=1210400 RepID=A0ABP9Q0S8_9ACTN
MRRLAPALTAVALFSLLAACGDDVPEAGEDPTVEVEEAGADDGRISFELDLEEGYQERTVITTQQTLDAAGQTIDVPPIEITQLSEVTGVDGDEITVEQTFEEVRALEGGDETTRAALESTLAQLRGTSGTLTFDRSGQVVDTDFELPDGVDPAIEQTFDQVLEQASSIGAVFPDEELGEGATWTLRSTLELNGIEVEQTATYTLESLQGEDYEVSVEIEQDYQEGDVAGGSIKGGTGTTTGTITGTAGTLLPTSAELDGDTEVQAEQGGSEQTVSTQTSITIESEVL